MDEWNDAMNCIIQLKMQTVADQYGRVVKSVQRVAKLETISGNGLRITVTIWQETTAITNIATWELS